MLLYPNMLKSLDWWMECSGIRRQLYRSEVQFCVTGQFRGPDLWRMLLSIGVLELWVVHLVLISWISCGAFRRESSRTMPRLWHAHSLGVSGAMQPRKKLNFTLSWTEPHSVHSSLWVDCTWTFLAQEIVTGGVVSSPGKEQGTLPIVRHSRGG